MSLRSSAARLAGDDMAKPRVYGRIVAGNGGEGKVRSAGDASSESGPVFDAQPGDGGEIGVGTNDGAVAEGEGNGSDLNVDLLHRPSGSQEKRRQAAIALCRVVGV